jgi:hypothetical protein
MTGARTLENMSSGPLRVMERARRHPHERQFSLAHLNVTIREIQCHIRVHARSFSWVSC